MQYQPNLERSRKMRVIIFALTAVAIVLVVGAVLISAAFHSMDPEASSQKSTSNSKVAKTNSNQPKINSKPTKPPKNTPITPKNKTTKSTSNPKTQLSKPKKSQSTLLSTGVFSSVQSPASQYHATSQQSKFNDDIPSTGPTDLIFTAFLIGLSVTLFLLNLNLVKTASSRA